MELQSYGVMESKSSYGVMRRGAPVMKLWRVPRSRDAEERTVMEL